MVAKEGGKPTAVDSCRFFPEAIHFWGKFDAACEDVGLRGSPVVGFINSSIRLAEALQASVQAKP